MRGLKSKEKQNTSRKEHQYGHKRKWSVFESELIHRKVKVGNEWQTRIFPSRWRSFEVAPRRTTRHLSLQTEMVSWDGLRHLQMLRRETKGQFVGYGTATGQRDAKLAESLC